MTAITSRTASPTQPDPSNRFEFEETSMHGIFGAMDRRRITADPAVDGAPGPATRTPAADGPIARRAAASSQSAITATDRENDSHAGFTERRKTDPRTDWRTQTESTIDTPTRTTSRTRTIGDRIAGPAPARAATPMQGRIPGIDPTTAHDAGPISHQEAGRPARQRNSMIGCGPMFAGAGRLITATIARIAWITGGRPA